MIGRVAIALVAMAGAGALACKKSEPAADVAAPPTAAPAPAPTGAATDGLWFPAPSTIDEHVRILAGPELRGRGLGTDDERAAATLIATWLRDAGAEPAGEDGWMTRFYFATRTSQNVVGIVRGTDPAAGHVVVGAHYDHLGTEGDGPDAPIYYGADDNASGVAGLVAITAALTHDGQRPRRTVIVVAFGAEEGGLYGSMVYTDHPVLPLADCAAMINLDMIGRAEFLTAREYKLARFLVPHNAIGALTSVDGRALADAAHAAGDAEHRPIVAASDFGAVEDVIRPIVEQRGDHASFARFGVPYLWLSTSMHDDYHRPTDTADKIDAATIATVGRIVVRVIATLPDRPVLRFDVDAR